MNYNTLPSQHTAIYAIAASTMNSMHCVVSSYEEQPELDLPQEINPMLQLITAETVMQCTGVDEFTLDHAIQEVIGCLEYYSDTEDELYCSNIIPDKDLGSEFVVCCGYDSNLDTWLMNVMFLRLVLVELNLDINLVAAMDF